MNPMVLGQKDLSHRLQAWVAENQTFIILVLVGGIGFFGLLTGFTVWRQNQEEKTAVQRFALITQAQEAARVENWQGSLHHYEELYGLAAHHPFFRVLALHGIALGQRRMEAFEESAKTFERAAKEPGHADPLASRFEAARSYRMAGDPQAEAMVQALLKEKTLSSDLKTHIEEELKWFQEEKKP